MNKDVIYIEPEDDITSIIRKLNSSEHKLVALVPPKRIGVLRSAVNTRLIAKNAKQSGKTVVIVSNDPSLTKLSAAAGIPVADTLQSRPKLPDDILGAPAKEAIPSEITIEEGKMTVNEGETTTDDEGAEVEVKEESPAEKPAKVRPAKTTQKIDDEVNSVELESESEKTTGEKDDKKKSLIPDMDKYKKWFIAGGVGVVVLIIFLVWALVFAPAAEILVSIRTTGNNFSENVSFTTETTKENTDEGIFYLDKQTYNADNTVEFEATGEKDVGEKAKGSLEVTLTVDNKTQVTLPAGTKFTRNGLNYELDKEVTYKVEDDDPDEACIDGGTKTNPLTICTFKAYLSVTAEAAGEKYNVEANSTGWTVSFELTE